MTVKQQYKLRYVFPTGGIPAGTVFEGDLDTYQGFIKAGIIQVIEQVEVKKSGNRKEKASGSKSDIQKPSPGSESATTSFESSDEPNESTRRYGQNEKDNGFYDLPE